MGKRKIDRDNLTLLEWRDLTNPMKHPEPIRSEMREMRRRVIADAGTSMATITMAIFRGTVGIGLLTAMQTATEGTGYRVRVDQHPPVETTNGILSYGVARGKDA